MKTVACASALVVSSLAMLLAGCGGSSSPGSGSSVPTATLASGGAKTVYVVEYLNTVLEFPLTTSGAILTSGSITPPSSMTQVSAVGTDSTGQIYVGGYTVVSGAYEICVYAAGSSSSASPSRTITESNVLPTSMAIDSAGLLYVTGPTASTIAVYAAGATGAATPVSLIAGAATQLVAPEAIALDSSKNIYVTNFAASGQTSTIEVFAAGANGNVAPMRTISPSGDLSYFYGVAVDGSGDVFASAGFDNAAGILNPSIVEFGPSATGAATPSKVITSAYLSYFGGDISVDSVGNLYLVNGTSVGGTSLLGFGPSATGNVLPGVEFISGAWTAGGTQIAVY
jgi:hypothetical protein